MCAVVLSMAMVEAGNGTPGPLEFPDAGKSQDASNRDPIILASNVEFQRTVQTQTTLIQHEALERRHKIAQKHAETEVEHLERKKEIKKRVR